MRRRERAQLGRARGTNPQRDERIVPACLEHHAVVLRQHAAEVDRILGARRDLQAEVDEVALGAREIAPGEPKVRDVGDPDRRRFRARRKRRHGCGSFHVIS
jgi:hypothetical protein